METYSNKSGKWMVNSGIGWTTAYYVPEAVRSAARYYECGYVEYSCGEAKPANGCACGKFRGGKFDPTRAHLVFTTSSSRMVTPRGAKPLSSSEILAAAAIIALVGAALKKK